MRRRIRATWALLLISGVVSASLVAPLAAQEEPPEADVLVRKMSAYLGSLTSFRVEADVTFDDVPLPGVKVQYSGAMEVLLRRPHRLKVDYRDDLIARKLWIDGETATLLLPEEEHWAQTSAESTVDATLKRLAADYGVSIPLDDFLLDDPYATLMAGAVRHRYVGTTTVAGVPCHHVVVGQEDINWQVWIEQGDKPLPRKLVITYKNLPMAPQFAALMDKWDVDPELADSRFQPAVPADTIAVDFTTLEEAQP